MSARRRLYEHLDPIPVPASIRDYLLDAYRAAILREEVANLRRVEREATPEGALGTRAGLLRAALILDERADSLREKSSREATATPQPGDPLVVRWDRTVIHPEADPTEDTIVCCLTDDGRPVALFLDEELREALGLLLVDPHGDGEDASTPQLTGRLARLLDAIRTHRGEWTTKSVQDLYRGTPLAPSDAPGGRLRVVARGDLHELRAVGHLVMHEERGRRYFTLNTRKGGA